jgi:hypothetical protein
LGEFQQRKQVERINVCTSCYISKRNNIFFLQKKSITEETQIINGTMKLAYCTGPYTIAVSNKGSETSGLRDRWTSF